LGAACNLGLDLAGGTLIAYLPSDDVWFENHLASLNAERVLALEERGHRLYGLWTPQPHWFNTVGPVPFGHVEDLPADGWRQAIDELHPDVVYGPLNWEAVPFVHQVMSSGLDAPFVWHFKESPFDCIAANHLSVDVSPAPPGGEPP